MTHSNGSSDPVIDLLGGIIGTVISSGAARGRGPASNVGDVLGIFQTVASKVGETNNARKETVNDTRAKESGATGAKAAPKAAASESRSAHKSEPSIFSTVGNLLGNAETKFTRGVEDLFAPTTTEEKVTRTVSGAPPFDVILGEDSVEFRFAVAGIKPEHVTADLQDEKLLVTINIPTEPLTGAREYAVREIWSGHFAEAFPIPTVDNNGKKEIDEANVSATVKDGLFTVNVPFRKRAATRINIS